MAKESKQVLGGRARWKGLDTAERSKIASEAAAHARWDNMTAEERSAWRAARPGKFAVKKPTAA